MHQHDVEERAHFGHAGRVEPTELELASKLTALPPVARLDEREVAAHIALRTEEVERDRFSTLMTRAKSRRREQARLHVPLEQMIDANETVAAERTHRRP